MTRIAAALLALGLGATPALADLAKVPAALHDTWQLAEVDGLPVAYSATLTIAADGRIAGQGPCNRYFGGVDGPLPDFRPTGLGATRMACDGLGDEQTYFDLLHGVDRLTWSAAELHLSGAGHQLVFRPAAK